MAVPGGLGRQGSVAMLPVGGAGEHQIEFLGGVRVRWIERVAAEQQEAQAGAVAGEGAVGAEELGPAVALEEGRCDVAAVVGLPPAQARRHGDGGLGESCVCGGR